MADTIKVVAKIDFTDAANQVPRKAGEEFEMERERGLLKAKQGFVEAYDEDGALIDVTEMAASQTKQNTPPLSALERSELYNLNPEQVVPARPRRKKSGDNKSS